MQDIIIAKPYEFVPPATRHILAGRVRPLLRPYLAPIWGVTRFDVEGIETLRAAQKRAGVLLVPNHCRPCDPMVVDRGRGRGARRHLYDGELAPVHGRAGSRPGS